MLRHPTGQDMDEAKMRAKLDACLLDERIATADSEAWDALPNPFPELSVGEEEEEENAL